MTQKFKTKHTIKIPKDIKTIYCEKTNLLIFVGPLSRKTVKLNVKIIYVPTLNLINVTNKPFNETSKNSFRHIKKLQGTAVAKIKQALIESSTILYHKLNLVGVGYRVFNVDELKNQICLKLGYSHLIYHKIPDNLNVFCVKFTKLFIFGSASYNTLTQTAASIRDCKLPEPYKGKGILHDQEKIVLKKGKKT